MRRTLFVLVSLSLLLGNLTLGLSADAKAPAKAAAKPAPKPEPKKEWTVTDRLEELQKDIDAGEKASELTAMEAANLREKASKITVKIDKMKAKNGGKLSYADNNKIEGDLNKLSLTITKDKLDKRVK